MEIKIKCDFDESEGYLLLTNEHTEPPFIDVCFIKDKKVSKDVTVNLTELFIALKALQTIKEQL